ncbi:MAG: FG-GAP-like repeat-containing protein [bacterium]
MNNDGQKDLVVTDANKALSVALSKKDGSYVNMGEFLSFENAREGTIHTGDFFGD